MFYCQTLAAPALRVADRAFWFSRVSTRGEGLQNTDGLDTGEETADRRNTWKIKRPGDTCRSGRGDRGPLQIVLLLVPASLFIDNSRLPY